jgi:hypothetical protein
MENMSQPLSNREVQATIKNYGERNVDAERFPTVSTLSTFMRVLGFLLVAGGVIFFLKDFAPWLSCKPPQQPPSSGFFVPPTEGACPFPYMGVGVAGLVFVIGLGIVAIGELLGMFRSIEGNTYNLLKVTQEADYKGRLTQGS